ncbi:MAG: hypothetical protein AAF449_17755, partial [Myxococcota bacterium]
GENNIALTSGITVEFDMSPARSLAVLNAELGELVELDIPDPDKPGEMKSVKVPVTEELRTRALAHNYTNEIIDAGVGGKVIVLDEVIDVTDDLLDAAQKAARHIADGTADAYKFIGPGSAHARLIRNYLGLDDIAKGLGRIRSAWGPRVSNTTLEGFRGLSRLTDVGVGATQVVQGVARAASGLAEFVGLGLDIYATIDAFKNGNNVDQGLATANLVLSAVGTAAGLASLLGPSVVGAAAFAAAGPVGVAALVATLVLALISPAIARKFTPEPTYADIYGSTIDLLTGNNAFGANVLNGPQVAEPSDEYSEVHFERGELRIPADATPEDIAQALGEAYEAGEADFLAQLYHLFFSYDQEQGAAGAPPLPA